MTDDKAGTLVATDPATTSNTGGDVDVVPTEAIHKALASTARTTILELLRAADDALDVAVLSRDLDLHHNTVRSHLAILEDAGLVTSSPRRGQGRGRPAHVFQATDRAEEELEDNGYVILAQVLADHVAANSPDPVAASERMGEAWGHRSVQASEPALDLDEAAGIDQVVALLDDVGFAPQLDDGDPGHPRLLLHRCPFRELAQEHQDVVCSIHLGLVRGAFDELGVDVEVVDLQPFVEPRLCINTMKVPA